MRHTVHVVSKLINGFPIAGVFWRAKAGLVIRVCAIMDLSRDVSRVEKSERGQERGDVSKTEQLFWARTLFSPPHPPS